MAGGPGIHSSSACFADISIIDLALRPAPTRLHDFIPQVVAERVAHMSGVNPVGLKHPFFMRQNIADFQADRFGIRGIRVKLNAHVFLWISCRSGPLHRQQAIGRKNLAVNIDPDRTFNGVIF